MVEKFSKKDETPTERLNEILLEEKRQLDEEVDQIFEEITKGEVIGQEIHRDYLVFTVKRGSKIVRLKRSLGKDGGKWSEIS